MILATFTRYSALRIGDVMKKLPFALAALAFLSSAAFAADLPVAPGTPVYKSPAMVPAPTYSWTGLYLNAGGGYGMWNAGSQSISLAGACLACTTTQTGGNGFVAVGGGGFDYQFGLNLGGWNPQIVAGLFGDYDYMDLKGTIVDPGFLVTGSTTETSAWAAGARAGILVTPTVLSYANVGVTGTHFSGSDQVNQATGASTGLTTPAFSKIGWFTGGGFESPLNFVLPPGFFLRTEYRYAYYGTANLTASLAGAPFDVVTFHPTVQTLTTQLVYRFNWNGN
jgi:outer membrane immunogenic protein